MADSKANRPWRILLLVVLFVSVTKSQTIYCNTTSPCVNDACCQWKDNQGICGYGSFCQTDCISNCNATAECGKDAKDPSASCPLNVCCSQWGFCGTGDLFCGNGCQGDNCGDPTVPSCSSNNVLNRVVGYYESWSSGRACDAWRPSDMAVSGLTHINYAFALFSRNLLDDSLWNIEFMDDGTNDVDSLIEEFVSLKQNNPQLNCYLSIGGWAFSDPGDTQSY
ncbi:hypothetical protein TMatcc_010300 [Talaromyces marneffei ATCC 18224]